MQFHVGKGDKIRFWTDLWVGDAPLASTFPDLFHCASSQEASVIDYMERRGDSVVWGPIFERNLNKMEESQFQSLLTIIGDVLILREGKDRRIWMGFG